MIDVRKLAASAAKGFGLSLKDDPTAWGAADGDSIAAFSALDIVDNCHAEAKRCAASGVASVLGKASEGIATAMDVAIYEDGPLADLDAVWTQHATGLSVDLSGVAAARDWQGRVDALREAIARAAPSVSAAIPAPAIPDILAYAESDYRLREAPALMALGRGEPGPRGRPAADDAPPDSRCRSAGDGPPATGGRCPGRGREGRGAGGVRCETACPTSATAAEPG